MVDRQVPYRQYDQRELDSQYNNRRRIPDYDDHLGRWRAEKNPEAPRICMLRNSGGC